MWKSGNSWRRGSQRSGDRRVTLRIPKKGTKEKLVELAAENARLVLTKDKERLKREEGRTIGAVKEIASLLGLDEITRMEAYDISNTNGFESVGSMVVYERGRPKRNDYRKFKIKGIKGADDYGSMRECADTQIYPRAEGAPGKIRSWANLRFSRI